MLPRDQEWYLQHRFEAVGEGTLKTFCGKCEAVNPPKVVPLKPMSHKCGSNACDVSWEEYKEIRDLPDYKINTDPEVKECCNHFQETQTPIDSQGWHVPCCMMEPYKTSEDRVDGACYSCDKKSFGTIGDKQKECCKYHYEKNKSFSVSRWTAHDCCSVLNAEKYPACESKQYFHDLRTPRFAGEERYLSSYVDEGLMSIHGTTITLAEGKYHAGTTYIYKPGEDHSVDNYEGWLDPEKIKIIDENDRVDLDIQCPGRMLDIEAEDGETLHLYTGAKVSIHLGYLPIGKSVDLTQLYFKGNQQGHPINGFDGPETCEGYMYWYPYTYGLGVENGYTLTKEAMVQFLEKSDLSECKLYGVHTYVWEGSSLEGPFKDSNKEELSAEDLNYPLYNGDITHWVGTCLKQD